MPPVLPRRKSRFAPALAILGAALLSACGGGGDGIAPGTAMPAAANATGSSVLTVEVPTLAETASAQLALPAFHAAPALLEAPGDDDVVDNAASVRLAPRSTEVAAEWRGIATSRLTPHLMPQLMNARTAATIQSLPQQAGAQSTPKPQVVTTYTPAQVRAAYALPALAATVTAPSASQAALMGAGQTVYIVDAMHDPNTAAELATFDQKFGLRACTDRAIAPGAALPLAAASAAGCEFSVVYSNAAGAMTATAPAYDPGWATEIALDVQWVHATAPMARIVLIEAPDASIGSLVAAVGLANAMGRGVVSMSFGAAEGSWTSSVDAAFAAPGMTYLAATGDSGAGVQWPSVSSRVLAVGGTSLTYGGTGTRSEAAWSGTGGGISQYVAQPAYQIPSVPGLGSPGRRSVADVAFNADPYTGQYLALIAKGSSAVSWLSAGGTSLATPQWAALVAVANAVRAQAGKAALGAPHATLYDQIAVVPGTYASTMADVTTGADGSCAGCSARAGYDAPTGLGTPNGTNLVAALSGGALPPAPPVVNATGIHGTAGTALSFAVSVTTPDPVTFTMIGAPSAMTLSTAGIVSWPVPVVGTYAVAVTARDTKTGLSGSATYTVTIAAPQPPGVTSGTTVTGKPGVALSFAVAVTSPDPLAFTLSGAPAGMTIGATGVVSWPVPKLGTYNLDVTARDAKTGLTGQGSYTVKIVTAGPVITAAAMTGVAGKPLTGTITLADATATSMSVSISGVPLGMGFSLNGTSIVANWPSPAAGSYLLKLQAVDSAGLSAGASVPVTITAR